MPTDKVVWSVLVEVTLVGRTGATPVAEEVVVIAVSLEPGGRAQDRDAHTRSVAQQPPPTVTGQAC